MSYQTFSHFQFDYKLSSSFYTGIIAHSNPLGFNVADYNGVQGSYIHTYSDKFPYTPKFVGAYGDLYIKNEILLFGKAGYEISKTLYHENSDGQEVNQSPFSGELDSGLAFEIGIAWRKRTARKFKY